MGGKNKLLNNLLVATIAVCFILTGNVFAGIASNMVKVLSSGGVSPKVSWCFTKTASCPSGYTGHKELYCCGYPSKGVPLKCKQVRSTCRRRYRYSYSNVSYSNIKTESVSKNKLPITGPIKHVRSRKSNGMTLGELLYAARAKQNLDAWRAGKRKATLTDVLRWTAATRSLKSWNKSSRSYLRNSYNSSKYRVTDSKTKAKLEALARQIGRRK